MAYTMEQFIRETHEMVIDEAIRTDPESILKRFDPEDRLRGLDPEDVLGRFDPATIEAWLTKQRRNS